MSGGSMNEDRKSFDKEEYIPGGGGEQNFYTLLLYLLICLCACVCVCVRVCVCEAQRTDLLKELNTPPQLSNHPTPHRHDL